MEAVCIQGKKKHFCSQDNSHYCKNAPSSEAGSTLRLLLKHIFDSIPRSFVAQGIHLLEHSERAKHIFNRQKSNFKTDYKFSQANINISFFLSFLFSNARGDREEDGWADKNRAFVSHVRETMAMMFAFACRII